MCYKHFFLLYITKTITIIIIINKTSLCHPLGIGKLKIAPRDQALNLMKSLGAEKL